MLFNQNIGSSGCQRESGFRRWIAGPELSAGRFYFVGFIFFAFLHVLIIIRLFAQNGYRKLLFIRHAFSPLSLLSASVTAVPGARTITGQSRRTVSKPQR